MKEDLYKKYLKNIKNGKTAIKKEYVDRGYFSYYSKREIYNHLNSKRIIIDGVNGNLKDFINTVINNIKINKYSQNKVIYIGKVGRKLYREIYNANPKENNITGYNISISTYEIMHILNRHGNNNEKYRGQNMIKGIELIRIADLLIETKKVVFIGKNALNLNVYNFISDNNDGTYNTLEFVGNGRHILGFQSLYINKLKK